MRQVKFLSLLTLVLIFFAARKAHAQTVIFTSTGGFYNNTDAVTVDTYGPVNVSNCTSISMSVNYNFSVPYPGPGNLESSDECPFNGGCAGDPNDPAGGGCDQCWDFFYVQFQLDGVNVNTQLVGVPGSIAQSGVISYGPICTNGATTATMIVETQTWAANEAITFNNITFTCWDGSSDLMVTNSPACAGQPFTLQATLNHPTDVTGTLWSGPGTIVSPTQLTTVVNNAPVGTNTYTFSATDKNGCPKTNTIDVEVTPGPTMQDPPDQVVCSGDQVDVMFSALMGNPDYNWTNSNTAIGLGASGTGDISFTAATVANPVTGTITVTPTENGCNGPVQTFTITVNPPPTVTQPNNVTVCGGNPVTVNFSGTSGSTFNWTNDNPAIGLAGSGTGNISFVSTNSTDQQTATFTVIPDHNGCQGLPVTFDITVNPTPTVMDPPDQTVCGGDQVDVAFTGDGSPNFSWTNNNTNIGLGPNGNGDISFMANNVNMVTTGTIQVTPSANGCTGMSQNFTVTVTPSPTVSQPVDVDVCGGAPVGVSFTGTLGATFLWTNDNTNIGLGASGSGNISFNSAMVSSLQVATIEVTPLFGACAGIPVQFTITIHPAPTVNDPADQTVCSGAGVSVNFTGTGNPTYAWTNSNIAIGLGANGTGNINFTASNVGAPTTGTITVTPSANGCTGASQTFTVTVTPAPTINQPSGIIACAGTQVATAFSGTPGATFSWTNSNTAIGLAASGTGDINFTSALVTSQQTATITVTPAIGACSGTPVSYTITINPLPTVNDPANQTVCGGTLVNVMFSGTGNPTFNWTNNNTAIGLGASGSGNIAFTTSGVSNPVTGVITVTPVSAACTGASQDFDITVIPAPVVNQPADQSACAGAAVSVIFAGTSGAVFSWTNDNPAIGLGASGTGDIVFNAANVTMPDTAHISVTPDLNGCSGSAQNFLIIVNPLPAITPASITCSADLLTYTIVLTTSGNTVSASSGTVTGSNGNFTISGISVALNDTITSINSATGCQVMQIVNAPNCNCPGVQPPNGPNFPVICEGTATPALTVSVGPGETVDWYAAPTGGAALLTGNTSFTPPGMFTAGTYTFYAEARDIATGCTSATRTPVTLTVNPIPTTNQPMDQTVCAGGNVSVNFTGTNGATFSWTNSNTGVGLGASGNGNISFASTNGGTTPLVANVSVHATLNGCVGMAQNFTITVNPIPTVMAPANETVCGGSPVNVTFSGSAGAAFAWTNSNTNIGLGASGNGNISFTAANVSMAELGNISVTPSALGCTGSTQNFSISVSPAPTMTPPLNQSVCAGFTVAVGFNGTNGATFSWTNDNPAIGLAASGTGGFTFASVNAGNTALVAHLAVTPMLNGCSGMPQNFTITVNPAPTMSVASVTCAPDLLTYTVVINSNATTVTATAGTVTGNGGSFTISGIPNGNSIVITAKITATGCAVTQSINAPTCTCPPINAPNTPNFPVICEGTATPSLMVNAGPGLTVDWYATSTGGMPLLSGSTTFTPPGMFGPGSYTFYAEARESSSGCVSATRTPVTLTVNALPTMTQPLDQSVCAGFVLSIGFNGTNGANFTWTNSNTAIGLPANGTGNITFTATNAGAMPVLSTVSVTPTLFGCQGTPKTFKVTVNPQPVASITGNQTICNGSSTTLTASGGASFSWSSGQNTAAITVNPANNTTYTVTVTSNGCVATSSASVKVNQPSSSTINQTTCDPAQAGTTTQIIPNAAGCDSTITTITTLDLSTCAPVGSLAGSSVNCFGDNTGMLTVSAVDGMPPYQYAWSNGSQTGNGQIPTAGTPVQISNLSAGNYTVTITSASGLTTTVTGQITSPTQLTAQANAVIAFGQYAISCAGASDAKITASGMGGSGQYQFSWSTGGMTFMIQNVGVGTYTVTLTDANNCTVSAAATVEAPPALSLALNLDNVECGESFLHAMVTPSGGVAPFSALVDGAPSSGGLNPDLNNGNHTIAITDANGCKADTTILVAIPPAPVIQLPGSATVSLGEPLTLLAQTNLTSWKDITWTPVADTTCLHCLKQTWTPTISGVYTVVITDNSGCTAESSTRVTVRNELDVFVPNVFAPNDNGREDFWTLNAGPSIVALNSLQIFDRWGDEIYHLDSPVPVNSWKGWDGRFRDKDVTPGVYVYYLELKLANGEIAFKKGDVTVVR